MSAELYFLPKLTGAEYLRLFCNARNILVKDFESRNIFDLPLHQYAATYFTGMQKKLALTAVLLQGNEYFILDEPFNGVDIQSNLLITEIILHLKALGKTVVLSSHIFATLRDTCEAIYLLEDGRFAHTFGQEDFNQLETQLKALLIGDRVQKLGLR